MLIKGAYAGLQLFYKRFFIRHDRTIQWVNYFNRSTGTTKTAPTQQQQQQQQYLLFKHGEF